MVVTKSRKSNSLKSKKFRNKKTKKVGKMRGGGKEMIDYSKTFSTIGRRGIVNPKQYANRISTQALAQTKQTTFIPQPGMRKSMNTLVRGSRGAAFKNKMASQSYVHKL